MAATKDQGSIARAAWISRCSLPQIAKTRPTGRNHHGIVIVLLPHSRRRAPHVVIDNI
jgi:hypothetical protein